MRILHCCLSCFYIDGYNYQENILPKINKQDGHDVMIVASTETYVDNKTLGYVAPCEYFNEDGILVKRIPYKWYPSKLMQHKLRAYKGLSKILNNFKPDAILFHGLCAEAIHTVANYKRMNPNVKLYVDSHEDFYNSARNFLSKNILHNMYRSFLSKSLGEIDKVLFVSYEVKSFVQKMYGLPESILEFYPLGGIIPPRETRLQRRNKIRTAHGVKEDDVLFVHSGKMEKAKKTSELVQALHAVQANNLKLLIVGSMTDEVAADVMPVVEADPRIEYLGWKSGEELMDYLCAADLYVQPGTQSATMQNALCCGSAAALYPYESHKYLLGDSVFYIETVEDMKNLFAAISTNPDILEAKRAMSNKIARERLDYKVLAARLYQ